MLTSVNEQLEASLPKVTRALFWLDLQKAPDEKFCEAINGLIEDFDGDDLRSVFLLTPTPDHLIKANFDGFQLESIDAIGGCKQQQQLKASDLYQEITFIMPVNMLELLESHPKKVAEILNRILKDLFRKYTALPSAQELPSPESAVLFSSSSPSPLVGLYHGNAEQTVVARFLQTTTSPGFFFALSFAFSFFRLTAFSEPAQLATSHPSPHHTRMLTSPCGNAHFWCQPPT